MLLVQASPSRPVIIADAFRDWPAMGKWCFDFFKRLPQFEVVVNDRAPARHADVSSGGRQRSLPVSLSAYLQYVQASPAYRAPKDKAMHMPHRAEGPSINWSCHAIKYEVLQQ